VSFVFFPSRGPKDKRAHEKKTEKTRAPQKDIKNGEAKEK
jgi:hypothetical protein